MDDDYDDDDDSLQSIRAIDKSVLGEMNGCHGNPYFHGDAFCRSF